MAHILAIALAFPSVVYTVLLGAALVYWIFVMIGAVQLDHGADGALDGVGEGAADGAAEAAGDHLEVGDGADAGDGHEGIGGILAALKLRSAPATVVLSSLALFSWLFCMLGTELTEAVLSGTAFSIARFVLFFLAPVLALFPTSAIVRPLGRLLAPPRSTTHGDLVGQICTIRTGTVTEKFGEATLEDGGAGLVVRVRIETGQELRRGDQAVIVGYDDERQEFTVASMEEALPEEPAAKKRARR